jgi:AcrR family transcriptional regulator
MERARGQILAAAASLVAEGGTASLTMAALARRSGVAKATVYNHFRDRREVGRALVEQQVAILSAECLRYQPEERLAVAARLIAESTTLAGLRRHDAASLLALVEAVVADDRALVLVASWCTAVDDAERARRWLVSYAVAADVSERDAHEDREGSPRIQTR